MSSADRSPLGRDTAYPQRYAPEVLHPVPRSEGRAALGLGTSLPFGGVDIWNAYELSWLNPRGLPVAAMGEIRVPYSTSHLVESKSLKLYLNGLAHSVFPDEAAVVATLEQDLSACAGAAVEVRIWRLDEVPARAESIAGRCLDELDIRVDTHDLDPDLLEPAGAGRIRDTVYTHLLRSLCPVTGQPDWASVIVTWAGPAIPEAGLLRYLVSFRNHSGFHEQVIERIFMDLLTRYEPDYLSVQGRFTRRGGLDINPFRSTREETPANRRTVRQ